jgi:hypothetical protein
MNYEGDGEWLILIREWRFESLVLPPGYAVARLIEVLRCKPQDHGFDSRWCHWNLELSFRTHVALGLTYSKTEMSTRNIYAAQLKVIKCVGVKRTVRWRMSIGVDKHGRLLCQPPRKRATSTTQALRKCLMSNNVYFLSDWKGWGGGCGM